MTERYNTPSTLKRFYNQAIRAGFSPEDLNQHIIYQGNPFKFVGFHKNSNSKVVLEESSNKLFLLDETTPTSKHITEKPKLEIKTIKMNDVKFDPNIFIPMLTGTPIDYMFSTKGGIFPGTNYMVIGDPGIGKSTLTLDILSNIEKVDKKRKTLFISGEMNKIDMFDYVQRYPKFGDIDTLFLGEYLEENPKEVIETIFQKGYDLILTDSFIEVQEAVQATNNMNRTSAEKWLIDLMCIHNEANNDRKLYTSFLMIQQVTKGGNFVGSNKLKHNTTGMMEIRYSNEFSGDRYIKFTKNRRGGKYDRIFFSLDKADDVHFDSDRLERDIEIKERIANEKETLLKEEELFETLFEKSKEVQESAAKKLAEETQTA